MTRLTTASAGLRSTEEERNRCKRKPIRTEVVSGPTLKPDTPAPGRSQCSPATMGAQLESGGLMVDITDNTEED